MKLRSISGSPHSQGASQTHVSPLQGAMQMRGQRRSSGMTVLAEYRAGQLARRRGLSLAGGLLSLAAAALCGLELSSHVMSVYFGSYYFIIYYIVCALATLFLANTAFDFWRYFSCSSPTVGGSCSPSGTAAESPSNQLLSSHSSPRSPASQGQNVLCYSPGRPLSPPRLSPNSLETIYHLPTQITPPASTSGHAKRLSPPNTLTQLPYAQGANSSPSFITSSTSLPWSEQQDASCVLRFRQSCSPPMCSSAEMTSNVNADHNYLHNNSGLEEDWSLLGFHEESGSSGGTLWSCNRSPTDIMQGLRKYQYQPACRSPTPSARSNDDTDLGSRQASEEVWVKLGVNRRQLEKLYYWMGSLRNWISETILVPLVKEGESVNAHLRRLGCAELQIGESSITSLKQAAVVKSSQIPSLNHVLQYLDVSANQDYLWERIRELANGGCLSPFRWNGGGDYKKRKWHTDLPTDCAIIMHVLSTYLDSRLPPNPRYPDGKTFTLQYFVQAPDKPDTENKNSFCIYQNNINPPHYQLVYQGHIYDVSKGRNNMFCTILMFLHVIKTKESGMLGRANLGMSGVNILWIFDEH
uniref:transmembrane protein 209 isoform X1 n=1 Tax=Myxine glutinosa TaxID=7769 RepID=UPI00358ECAD9